MNQIGVWSTQINEPKAPRASGRSRTWFRDLRAPGARSGRGTDLALVVAVSQEPYIARLVVDGVPLADALASHAALIESGFSQLDAADQAAYEAALRLLDEKPNTGIELLTQYGDDVLGNRSLFEAVEAACSLFFGAEVRVLVADGTYSRIDQVGTGDRVRSWNSRTGECL